MDASMKVERLGVQKIPLVAFESTGSLSESADNQRREDYDRSIENMVNPIREVNFTERSAQMA